MHSDCAGTAFGSVVPSAALAIAKAAVGIPTKGAGEQGSAEIDQQKDLPDLEAARLRRAVGEQKDNTATQQESAPQAVKHENKAPTKSCDPNSLDHQIQAKEQPNSSFFQALIEKEVSIVPQHSTATARSQPPLTLLISGTPRTLLSQHSTVRTLYTIAHTHTA